MFDIFLFRRSLRQNRIKSIEKGAFKSMSNLQHLWVTGVTQYIRIAFVLSILFICQLFWTQAWPEGRCTNGIQVPCEVTSLPNPTTCKGWPHHRGLRPLLFSNSDVGSFTLHKNKSVKFVITKCSKYNINVRQQSKRGSVLHKIFSLQDCHTVVLGNVLSGNVTL